MLEKVQVSKKNTSFSGQREREHKKIQVITAKIPSFFTYDSSILKSKSGARVNTPHT